MFDRRNLHLLSTLLLILLTGCSAFDLDDAKDAGGLEAPGDLDEIGDGSCIIEHGVDSDGDGLLDIYEDLNQNCLVDEGETDPFNPDTDGDGLLDGDEDADGNGVWDKDRGELNPLAIDTDGNGIPDAEEPKARVCNRMHAKRVLTERRILPEGRVLYLHPEIKDAVPFGSSKAVFIQGHQEQDAAIIFESELGAYAFKELLSLLGDGLLSSDSDSYIQLKNVYEHRARGTLQAHMHLANYQLSLSEIIEILSGYIPDLSEPMPLLEKYQPESLSWDIQLQGEQLEEGGTRWALSWTPNVRETNWFDIARPQLLSVGTKTHVRFVCENIDVQSRPRLHVLLAVDHTAANFASIWMQTIEGLVSTRTARGSETKVYALQNSDGNWTWDDALADVNAQNFDGIAAIFEGESFDQTIAQSLQNLPWENEDDDAVIFILSGTGDENESEEHDELPPMPEQLRSARAIVASPTDEPFACAWRMQPQRSAAIERLVQWSHARHVGNCGSPDAQSEPFDTQILDVLAAQRWAGTEREAIPGTIWLADYDDSLPARSQFVAGHRVILAPNAKVTENTAVSFSAWFE